MDPQNNIEEQQSLSLRYGYIVGYSHATRALFFVSENGQLYTSTCLPGTHMEQTQTCSIPNPLNFIEYYRAFKLGLKCGDSQMVYFNNWTNENHGSGATESNNTTFDMYSNTKIRKISL